MAIESSKPFFISFEGGEGSGKTTQIKYLKNLLDKNNISSVITREPGGSPIGNEIRSILLNGDANKISALTETLLFYAERNEHINKVIIPNLKNGISVITDRFYDSTDAYQSNRNVDKNILNTLKDHIVKVKPDITFILDINPEVGLARSIAKNGSSETRFEEMGLELHKKINNYFKQLTISEPNRCVLIDASKSIEDVHNQIKSFLEIKKIIEV